MAHTITPKLVQSYPSIVQVNDTEVCCWSPTLANLKRHGLRRNMALCWRKKREKAVVKIAKKTICNSEHTSSTIRKIYQMPKSRVATLYKAIDLESFQLAAKTKTQSNSRIELVFVGSNWRLKGLDTLFRAITLLDDSQLPIHLTVIGSPSESTRTQYVSLAKKLSLSKQVTFAGRVTRDELPRALANSDMLVLPSYEEALGLAAIEALATGIPVVASNVGGLPEVVRDRICGCLVQPGDVTELTNAIESVMRTPTTESAVHNRQQFVERFGLQRLENELRSLYAEVGKW